MSDFYFPFVLGMLLGMLVAPVVAVLLRDVGKLILYRRLARSLKALEDQIDRSLSRTPPAKRNSVSMPIPFDVHNRLN